MKQYPLLVCLCLSLPSAAFGAGPCALINHCVIQQRYATPETLHTRRLVIDGLCPGEADSLPLVDGLSLELNLEGPRAEARLLRGETMIARRPFTISSTSLGLSYHPRQPGEPLVRVSCSRR